MNDLDQRIKNTQSELVRLQVDLDFSELLNSDMARESARMQAFHSIDQCKLQLCRLLQQREAEEQAA